VNRRLKKKFVLAVGNLARSPRGTQVRQWANAQLEQCLVKGLAMDDERLKQIGGGNCFDELLARIRDIRSSERVFWTKLDSLLTLSDRELLMHAGAISDNAALAKAQSEFDKFLAIEDAKPQPVDLHFEEAIEQARGRPHRSRVGTRLHLTENKQFGLPVPLGFNCRHAIVTSGMQEAAYAAALRRRQVYP
jgi:hypothetical protein